MKDKRSFGDLMKPSLKEKDVAVIFDLKDSNLFIETGPYLIVQMLINLILNVLDDPLQFHIQKLLSSQALAITEKHNYGSQITVPAFQQKSLTVFLCHFSVPKKTGSGIGLSLCKLNNLPYLD